MASRFGSCRSPLRGMAGSAGRLDICPSFSPLSQNWERGAGGVRAGLLALFLCLLLTLLTLLTPAHAASVDTEVEKFLGKQVAWGLQESSGVDTDPLLLNWVRGIGAKVSAPAPRKDVTYSFAILGTDAANAIAAPGGYIFVTRGMLDYVESDDELASVL